MIILGIDPGFERLGIAILEKNGKKLASARGSGGAKEKILFSECFKTSADLEFPERLKLIGLEIKKIIKKYHPEVLAIETLFFTSNQKTVMHVAEARGVVIYECKKADLKIFEASPPQIKMATTGYGRASKDQIMKMVKILVPMDKNKTSDDELDAVAAALTASAHLR
jgi:crossover junction endodeoxyribonuclease RuvC